MLQQIKLFYKQHIADLLHAPHLDFRAPLLILAEQIYV
jgi:hypothetical protein